MKRPDKVKSGKIRALIGKVGLDGHDRGVKVVATALRDAGIEVIYTGLHQTPEQIVGAAIQEDVDAIGISVLSGAHNTLFVKILDLLRVKGASDIVLFGGGIIPYEDVAFLKEKGVRELFTPGAGLKEIVDFVKGIKDSQVSGVKSQESGVRVKKLTHDL